MLATRRFTICVAFVVSTVAAAQQPPSIRQDTTFPVELRHTIHGNSAKVGDPVEFRTIQPVLIGNGVVIPANTLLSGAVEEVQTRSSGPAESFLSIRVHTLRWENNEIPLNAVVSSVYYARASYLHESQVGLKPTFLEGIQIVAHLSDHAYTEFSSRKKGVVLRNGVLLLLRQIDPENYRAGSTPDQFAARH